MSRSIWYLCQSEMCYCVSDFKRWPRKTLRDPVEVGVANHSLWVRPYFVGVINSNSLDLASSTKARRGHLHLNITGEQIHCSPVNGSARLFAHILAVPNQGVRAKSLDSGSENPLKGSILFNFWHISVMFEVFLIRKWPRMVSKPFIFVWKATYATTLIDWLHHPI